MTDRAKLVMQTCAVAVATVLLAACAGAKNQDASDSSPRSVSVGSKAPAFSLASADHGEVSLEDFRGKSGVLLYFSMGPG